MRMFLMSAACLSLLLSGCEKTPPYADTGGADEVVHAVLNDISKGNVEEVYNTYFTQDYRTQMEYSVWRELAMLYHEKLGNVLSMERNRDLSHAVNLEGQVSGTFIYAAKWQKATGGVSVTMIKQGDGWKIASFQIDSDVLDLEKEKNGATSKPAVTKRLE